MPLGSTPKRTAGSGFRSDLTCGQAGAAAVADLPLNSLGRATAWGAAMTRASPADSRAIRDLNFIGPFDDAQERRTWRPVMAPARRRGVADVAAFSRRLSRRLSRLSRRLSRRPVALLVVGLSRRKVPDA